MKKQYITPLFASYALSAVDVLRTSNAPTEIMPDETPGAPDKNRAPERTFTTPVSLPSNALEH